METIPAKITSKLRIEMDSIINEGWYSSKSEFIRDAIREKIEKAKLERMEDFLNKDIKWGLHGKD